MDDQFDQDGFRYGWHRIHYAAARGELKELKTFLDNGTPVGLEAKLTCVTALHVACSNGQTRCVQFLIDRKAGINKLNDYGETPLMRGAAHCYSAVVKMLLDHKADRSLRSTGGLLWKNLTALDIAKRMMNNEEVITILEASPAPDAPPAPFPDVLRHPNGSCSSSEGKAGV